MKLKFPSKPSFRAFLEEHKLDFVGRPSNQTQCPLAMLISDQGYIGPEVGYDETSAYRSCGDGIDTYQETRTPKWAEKFMKAFDYLDSRWYTGAEVSEVLKHI